LFTKGPPAMQSHERIKSRLKLREPCGVFFYDA
jgi:hypothetical protein